MLSASPSASSSQPHQQQQQDVQDATYAHFANGLSSDSSYIVAASSSSSGASTSSQPRQFNMSHQIHPPHQQATPPSPSAFASQHPGSAGAMTSSGSASAYLTASSPQRGTSSPASDNGSPATHGSSPTQIKFDPGMSTNMYGGGGSSGYRGMPERSDSMASFTNHDASIDMSASPASTPGGPGMTAAQHAGMSMPPPPARIASGSGAMSSAAAAAEEALRPSTKFVHKLYRMVSDTEYQHLISWNATGSSVVVTNFDEFSKEVLGKHFKHSNFSSFIRQLNMYGFYKVNKTPRGHRNAVDTQVWEFSHPKFLRGRADLLDEIRRKALDSEHARVEARDLQYSVSVGQMQLRAQVEDVQFRLDECMEVNVGLRGALVGMREVLGGVLDWIKATNGGQLPYELRMLQADIPIPSPMASVWPESPWGAPPPGHDGPPIFVTEPQFGGSPQPQQQQPPGHHPQDHPQHAHHAHQQQQQHGEDYTFAMGNMGLVSPVGSRRVSSGSAQSEMMLNTQQHAAQHASQGQQSPMLHSESRPMSASRSNSFGEPNGASHFGPPAPGFSHGRPIAGKPGLTGLNIDTSSMSHAAMMQAHQHQQQQQHLGPGSAGGPLGSPGNPGLGVMTPMGGPGSHMLVAMNTPLPPSPAVATANSGGFMLDPTTGSPFDGTPGGFAPHGFAQHSYAGAGPYSAAASSNGAADPFVGAGPSTDEEMLRPNAKSLRTPLKRTASNSKERTQAAAAAQVTPPAQGLPAPPSPGLMKRKSPV